MAENPNQKTATPPTTFGPAREYAREGSSHHVSGWQEAAQPAAAAERRAPRAQKGAIPRTPLAERLKQRVAEQEKR
jgi:hypothetical protein